MAIRYKMFGKQEYAYRIWNEKNPETKKGFLDISVVEEALDFLSIFVIQCGFSIWQSAVKLKCTHQRGIIEFCSRGKIKRFG